MAKLYEEALTEAQARVWEETPAWVWEAYDEALASQVEGDPRPGGEE